MVGAGKTFEVPTETSSLFLRQKCFLWSQEQAKENWARCQGSAQRVSMPKRDRGGTWGAGAVRGVRSGQGRKETKLLEDLCDEVGWEERNSWYFPILFPPMTLSTKMSPPVAPARGVGWGWGMGMEVGALVWRPHRLLM